MCSRHDVVLNGTHQLRDAMKGLVLRLAYLDQSAGRLQVLLDNKHVGLTPSIMDKLAKLAGFTFNASFRPHLTHANQTTMQYLGDGFDADAGI